MLEMYKGLVNSPETTITNNINTSDTIIYVVDPARVPTPPNLMTLGTGTNAETVKVLSIDGNALTVQRGFQGVAKDWLAGTIIARNFTEYDYNALRENIETLDGGKVDKIAGKGLSTEDYTTAEKTKLEGIATEANKTTINNTLTSTSTTAALSAAQGKVLKDTVDTHLAETASQTELGHVKVDNETITIDENGVIKSSVAGVSQEEFGNLKSAVEGFHGIIDNDIYGIEVDIPNNTIVRLAGSVGKLQGADFDNISAYNRRRCILADDRTVLAYYGETGYTETGKTTVAITKGGTTYPIGTHVQVMVEQPKFYYRREPLQIEPIANGKGYHLRKWRDYITCSPKSGFTLHPAFYRNGVEYDYIYLGAYEGCIYDVSASAYLTTDQQVADFNADKLSSIAGVKPASGLTQNLTLPNTRKLANNRGTGWQQMDVLAHYAEVMLMAIEYASFDSQSVIGRGVVDKESGTGNESVNTGATSSLGNVSGSASGTNGLVSISYRGRENPWGNIWIFTDGLNIEAKGIHEAYWADSGFVSDIKTTPYKNCGFTLAKANGYISAIGHSEECDFMYIPSETLGAENRPLNDYFYQNNTYNGFWVTLLGGGWENGSLAGACFLNADDASSQHSRDVGGCLLCLP